MLLLLPIYFLVFFLGAAFGSFFNVCIYRIPRKESIVSPPSHCPGCNTPIRPWNNIPIVSYLALRGKCRICGMKIHWHYFMVELLTAILFLSLFIHSGNQVSVFFIKYLLLFSMGVIIFFIDAFHMIIPDSLSLPLIPIGLVFSLVPGSDVSVLSSLSGAAAGFILFYGLGWLYLKLKNIEAMGGGDVKLITALGAFLGFRGVLISIFFASILAIVGFIVMRLQKDKHFPFGPFLILGAMVYVFLGNWMVNAYLGLFGI